MVDNGVHNSKTIRNFFTVRYKVFNQVGDYTETCNLAYMNIYWILYL